MVERDRFDAYLVEQAVTAGADFVAPCRLNEVTPDRRDSDMDSNFFRLC